MEKQTCEERLPEHLAGRLADLRHIVDHMGIGETEEPCVNDYTDPIDEALDYILWSTETKYTVYRLDLSTGGPADRFEVWVRNAGHEPPATGEITRIVYHFQDWFDGAVKELEGEEFELVSQFALGLLGI